MQRTWNMNNEHKIWALKYEDKSRVGRPRHLFNNNVKV
jgi:hypothetical protein